VTGAVCHLNKPNARMAGSDIAVGVIGYRNHAGRLIDLVDDYSGAQVGAVYHPHTLPPHLKGTSDFEALLAMDAIMIASPNSTHAGYLNRLHSAYGGYLFCEKPVVTHRDEFEHLRVHPDRTFFNFNYRFSRFAECVRTSIDDRTLGTPIQFSACTTQGLAFKPGYEETWRADAARHLNGIAETKAIHQVDLAIELFGHPVSFDFQPLKVSGVGTAHDTCRIAMQCERGTYVDILASYAAPLTTHMLGSNGVIEYRDRVLRLFSPRDTFDERGYFAAPPETVLHDFREQTADLYADSLKRAVSYFLDTCRKQASFPEAQFDASMETTRQMLRLGKPSS